MAEALITSLVTERLGEMLQGAGYRVENFTDPNGTPHLKSATGGVMFNVRFGNRAVAPAQGFIDFTYLTVIKVDGELPLERINEWNRQRRFARLHRAEQFLVFDMDVIVAGGVTERFLRGTLELWDRLIQELVVWLRGDTAPGAANAA